MYDYLHCYVFCLLIVLVNLSVQKVKIDAMQFGFMPGKGTTDAVFTVRQMQDKYGCKRKKLYFAFVDLEKAFDRVPRGHLMGSKQGRSVRMVGKGSHGDV